MKKLFLILVSAVLVGCNNPTTTTTETAPIVVPGIVTNVSGNVVTAVVPDGNEYACFVDNGKAFWRGMHVECEFLMPSDDVRSYQFIDLWREELK